jgi:hypothetical protein
MPTTRSLFFAAGAIATISHAAFAQQTEQSTLTATDRSYQAELIGDAASRTSLLEGEPTGASSGFKNGKFFITDGGNNTLNFEGFMQFRYIMDVRKDQPNNADVTPGFQMRRTRLIFNGTVFDKNLSYQIQGDFDRGSGNFTQLDAYAKYAWDNGVYTKWGQYKLPLLHEELVSDPGQLTIERSVVNVVFTANRVQAAELGWSDGKKFRVMGDFSDGINSLNTDFNSAAESDFALTGRGEWIFAGDDFKRFEDYTSWRDSSFAGLAGAAVHYQDGGQTGFTVDRSVVEGTADVSVEGNGWNAAAAAVIRRTEVAGGASTTDYGFLGQGGIFLSDQIELFGRYDVVIPDVGDPFNTITGGATYYISPHSHAVQLSADLCYYLDDTTVSPVIPAGSTGTGFLADPNGGQWSLRLQMQVMF